MIFIIDDDKTMAECVAKACGEHEVQIFGDALGAMDAISEGVLPGMILMEIMLTGPDGFTFLNELISYPDTAKIPVVIVSDCDFKNKNLSEYGVVGVLNKDTMTPQEVESYVEQYAR